jgi:hypothetical protein
MIANAGFSFLSYHVLVSRKLEGFHMDYEAYKRRLKSFTAVAWANPSSGSGTICGPHAASYGWELTKGVALRCDACKEVWVLVLPAVADDPCLCELPEIEYTWRLNDGVCSC